jgi:outer membrane protein OmpA-like peptidoglycan-associated protein
MKKTIFIFGIALLLIGTLVSAQAFGQFKDKGIRAGIAIGALQALTQDNNSFNGIGRIFIRHNIADYFDGDLSGSIGQLGGDKYQSDLYLAEYKVLYKPFTFDEWEPYVGAGLGLSQFHGNLKLRNLNDDKYKDGYIGYLPITLGTEYALSDCIQLDANVNLSYAFSNTIVSTRLASKMGTGNDAWWGISVGISYTIFGGGPSAAELEAARAKAEQEALHAKELAAAEAQRVQDSIKAAAEAAAREKEAKIAEARRLQEAAEVQRVQDSIKAAQKLAESKKEVEVPKPELPKPELPKPPEQPKPEALKAEVGKAIVLEGVVFQSGKAVLLPESEQILSSAKKTLEDNPDIRVEIRGYTDNVGNAKKNLQLSQARAAAVKAWLVKNGIASTRITAKGYGDKNPIGDNKTAEGRTKNRRIEFFRTK